MDDCFHGKLDRRTAEERLAISGQPGSYLVRESDRQSGSVVLSFLGKTGINHFRITRVCGAYFIAQRKFDSLVELIGYYHHYDLLTGEQLVHPVASPEPVTTKCRLFVSVLPYTGLGQDELSFKKETLFIYEHDHGGGWYWCRDVKTGAIGLVFSNLIEEVSDDIDPNEIFPWFHANLSKADAVDKLAKVGRGSFLVKASDSSKGNYTLYYHAGETVQRFQIAKSTDNRYIMGARCFDSLGQIIELYKEEQIIEGHCLKYPVAVNPSMTGQFGDSSLSSSMRNLEVRENPEDIYNTVKQCQELAKSQEVRGWLNLKKADITKKWKRYYFILNPITSHLYYYEKPQQTKPKGLIDLNYSMIYTVHDSLFDCPQCFQLIEKSLPCFASQFYIRCDDDYADFNRWIKAIRKFTNNRSMNQNTDPRSINSDPTNEGGDTTNDQKRSNEPMFVEKRSLRLDIVEANSLKVSQPQFFISYNDDVKIAKTQVKSSPIASFEFDEAGFELINIPLDVRKITVSLHQSNKRSKSTLVAELAIGLENLEADRLMDHWFELQSIKVAESYGRIRLKLLFKRDIIMRRDQYVPLEDLIGDPSNEFIYIFDQFPHPVLARALVNVLIHKRTVTSVLKSLIEREVGLQSESEALFNINTLTSTMLESFIRSSCQKVLIECLKKPIRRLLEIGAQVNSQSACDNLQDLFDVLDDLIQKIYNSIPYYPMQVRYLFAILQRSVQLKWPKEQLIRTRVVAGFLFLRLICATILRPKQFGLLNRTHITSPDQKRFALIITNCLQNLANVVDTEFKAILSTLSDYNNLPFDTLKTISREDYAQTDSIMRFILLSQIDEWMEVLHPVILKNKLGLVKFVDELCNVELCDPNLVDNTLRDLNNNSLSLLVNDDDEIDSLAQDLALVHAICELHREELEKIASTSSTAKRLIVTINILTQRKAYYSKLKKSSQAQKVFITSV